MILDKPSNYANNKHAAIDPYEKSFDTSTADSKIS